MKRNFFHHLVLLTTLIPFFASAAETIPVEHFARLPDFRHATLSPDGSKVAGLVMLQGHEVVVTKDIETNEFHLVAKASEGETSFNWMTWANNERLLLSYRFPSARQGTSVVETRLISILYDGSDRQGMFRKKSTDRFVPNIQDNVVDLLPDDDEHILMGFYGKANLGEGLYKVDVESGRRKAIKADHPYSANWVTDQQGRPRIFSRFKGTNYKFFVINSDGKKGDMLWEFERFSGDEVWPMGFGLDENELYIRAYHGGRYAVFKVNLEDPKLQRELVLADPERDVEGGLVYSPKTREVVGIRYAGGDGQYHFWDGRYQNTLDAVDAALPDTYNRIVSISDDEQRYLIYSSNDVSAGVYRIVDMAQGGFFTIGETYPELSDMPLMSKKRVNIEARDGLQLEARLTMPDVAEPQNLPVIVHPHGGPISRDGDDFDYWTQFFANRGYAVLQVNFRGSSGYGIDFVRAGLKSWGLAMQDDLEDSTQWLIDEGIADPDRICIVGASYGGYAALMGVAKTPDLYACAVSFAGVSDIKKLVGQYNGFLIGDIAREQLGTDRKQQRETSPRFLTDSIEVPVLLAHGDKDRSVSVEQSRLMHAAMQKSGKQVDYMEFEEGDHYLSMSDHRMEFFKAMDAFLAEHLAVAD